ncbi:GNAT family N-acetyltransferase [Granulicella tundricola]|uniref:GCN5-related N-acetyltransferase n=1 Tax=Granulicella tundricola (strain ATCC BAA-1859 / DSM 23138 / MP5ACTX9) TaxID=1198114 RepID=E8WZ15_GRATM|nr:GNAT family N-acetyltransferase [Granulicella tundricola]ADW69930.1 GCN5-related N-acetyltransferase [Granulicella tundricola MP5ACTX9]
MTSPTPSPQLETKIEILDLRHFNARQLRPLLEEQAQVWKKRLRWNYEASTELLLKYLDQQILPGFVALLRGRILGYCFCVYEGNKAVIGDIYVLAEAPSRLAVTHTLIRHLLEVLEASPEIDRIESQLLLFEEGQISPAFTSSGFTIYPRLFLECDLPATPIPTPSHDILATANLDLIPWSPNLYQASAELIHASYIGHLDSDINDQYRSLHGSLRFLHNIVRFPGCGIFDPEASWLLRDRATNALAAVILCSRVAPDVAHVTQLCIAGPYRGYGLGKFLLQHTMSRLPSGHYRALTLTVSEANEPALRLYTSAGFHQRLRFEALVLDKTVHPERFKIPTQAEPATEGSGLFAAFSRKKATPARN